MKSITFFLPLALLALGFSLLPYHYITAQTTSTESHQEQQTLQQLSSVLQALQTLLSSLFPQTQAQTADITTGLVGHWTFNEGAGTTASDSSGNNNTGTLINGPIWTTGKIGQALDFDGVNDYVDLGGGAGTIERIGSLTQFDTDGGNTGSTSVSIPADATLMVVGLSGYAGGVSYYSDGAMTINSAAMTAVDIDASVNAFQGAMFYRVLPSTGSQTLAWDWVGTDAQANPAMFVYGFYKGIDTSSPVRDTYGLNEIGGIYVTDTLTAQTGDMVIAWTEFFKGDDGSVTWTNATEIFEATIYGYADGGWAEASPSGNVVITATTNGDDGGIGAIVFKPGAGAGPSLSTKSVSFWMKNATSTTQKMLDLNGTASISDEGGTITATNFTSPTIYVDGVVNSTVNDTAWHHVVVTTDTAITADAIKFGVIGSTYFGGSLDEVRVYNRALSVDEVKRLYNMGR